MRKLGLSGSMCLVVLLGGCAGGDEDAPGDATPIIDASADVPGIEIGNTDTGSPVDSGSADSGTLDTGTLDTGVGVDSATVDSTVTDTALADTATADTKDSAVADTFVADTFVADTFVADTAKADTFVADTFVADTFVADTGTPYRHTVTIDGTNDFTAASEKLSTTTSSYDAYVTWDDTGLYVGYTGPDITATGGTTKWLFVYLDVDPGSGTGSSSSEQYNTQKHVFASGFGAEYYARWRLDDSFEVIKKFASGSWTNTTSTFPVLKVGSLLEIKIPFSALGGTPAKLGVTTFLINEASGGEWTYAGLYNTSFTDGYSGTAAPKTIANYLRVDLASSAVPNSGLNKAP